MASKSKKRRRVLGASCILAALIIAGSSFAWFTSKDEVTNRLSANSDYGVSIVESFVPPKNMVPGETVNKDVYAVNTGSIDSFVKESISGVLNYDYEEVVESFAETNVQLSTAQVKAIMGDIATEDGIVTYEAGSYLAWTDAEGVDIEGVNIGRKADVDDTTNDPAVASNPWKPTKEGAYVFRRAINHGEGESTNPFTYAGYYYVPTDETPGNGKYYKIVLGNDDVNYPYATTDPSTTPVSFVYDIYTDYSAMGFNGAVDTNVDTVTGVLKKDPTYRFVKSTTMDDKAVNLVFEDKDTSDGTAHPARLVATYGTGLATDSPEKAAAQAKVSQAIATYENELGEYDAAVASETNAKANYDYAVALANARNKLYTALNDYQTKWTTNDGKESTYNTERGEVNAYAAAMKDGTGRSDLTITDGIVNITTPAQTTGEHDFQDGIAPLKPEYNSNAGVGVFTDNEWNSYAGNNNPTETNEYVKHLRSNDDYQAAITTYINAYNDIYGADGSCGDETLINDVNTLLEEIKTLSAEGVNSSDPDAANTAKIKVATLKSKADTLINKFNVMKQAYLNMTEIETAVTGLTPAAGVTDKLDTLIATANQFKTNANTLSGLIDDYDTAEDNYNASQDDLSDAKLAWQNAVDTYNNEVKNDKYGDNDEFTGATKTYEDTLLTVNNPDDASEGGTGDEWDSHTRRHKSENDANVISPVWSARASGGDPKFTDEQTTTLKAYDGHSTLGADFQITQITEANMPTDSHETTKVVNHIGDTDGSATAAKTYAEWKTEVATRAADVSTANDAVKDAKDAVGSSSNIKFYINLADDYDTNWTMDDSTNGSTKVDFYLNKILTAGETSGKLVDSVEFANTVTPKDYKNLTFDLDVALESIQATYDGNNYSTEAVNNADNFNMEATVTTPGTKGSAVTWGDKDEDGVVATKYSLKVGDTTYNNATVEKGTFSDAETDYTYKLTVKIGEDDTVFYGDSNMRYAEFVKAGDHTTTGTLGVVRE